MVVVGATETEADTAWKPLSLFPFFFFFPSANVEEFLECGNQEQ